ncbi:hypothetical protein T02_2089, partial [Trichinella nativa]
MHFRVCWSINWCFFSFCALLTVREVRCYGI